MVQAPGLKQDTMLTHIIFEIHVNSKIQQKLHDSHMSSWTSPVQSSPAVLHQTWKQPLNQYRLQSSIMLTLCVCCTAHIPDLFSSLVSCQTTRIFSVLQTSQYKPNYRYLHLILFPPSQQFSRTSEWQFNTNGPAPNNKLQFHWIKQLT